jgi:tRNA-modifying protein YgfZ
MADANEQARFLSESVGLRKRDDLVLVNISGDDRREWLNGQVTNDVRTFHAGDAVYALAVTVRGKIMADVWVLDRGEQLAVLLPKTACAAVLASFEQQIIMEDVELAAVLKTRVISVQGPRAHDVLEGHIVERHRADELGHGGYLALLPDDASLDAEWPQLRARAEQLGGGEVDDQGFELARLRAGRALFGRDFWDQHYPQEAGLITRAVSFNKGCYLGQEVVCTLESRGRASRRLVTLEAPLQAGLPRGASLVDGSDREVGQLTSVAADPERERAIALGYVKTALGAAGTELRAGDVPWRVGSPVGDQE